MNSGRGGAQAPAAGGPARHIPVLRDEILAVAAPRDGGLYARVVALDRDPTAIAGGEALVAEAQGRLTLIEAPFSKLAAATQGLGPFDAVLFDVGVSSMQLDEAARGFSFRHDGPLDMRMAQAGPSAADIVNGAEEEEIADILFHFGEERASRRIARAIVADRAKKPFETTGELAGMIARVAPAKPGELHAATRSFQALRIAVNDELGELVAGLCAAEAALRPGGRLAVVSFHSLEDRIAKLFFAARSGRGEAPSRRLPGEPEAEAPTFSLEGRQPIVPSQAEAAANPRARSAKLRWGTRLSAPARAPEQGLFALARLPRREKPAKARKR
ncbi:16S rRNA (cytosine(1402)-N(4))-methyltransferase RsmH [Methylocella sp.]|uniref:16S rRNA (cytosine(1402)-N(4))-methyltransferase RsmH n=1 Tax=Methylocella sp. TaxID=1978226 RepID=UPI00378425D1